MDVKKVVEHTIVVFSDVDSFSEGSYARVHKNYGITRKWRFDCKEYGVDWASSVIVALQVLADAGTTVTLLMTEPPHDISESVKVASITNMDINKEAGRKTFTLNLVEIA